MLDQIGPNFEIVVLEKHVAKTSSSEKKDHIGSNWIKFKAILEKHVLKKERSEIRNKCVLKKAYSDKDMFLKKYVLKEHGLDKTWS